MIAVLQRVKRASVVADGVLTGEIENGLLVLLGVGEGDTEEDAALLAAKIAKCRIFCDDAGKMNRSVVDVGGGVMVVSNFTLLANYRRGNRPDFLGAAAPDVAKALYLHFVELMKVDVAKVATGEFGADMQIDLCADGPITITMDSNVLKQPKRGM